MLDRNTKDLDASVELLQDRKRFSLYVFILLLTVGWFLCVFSIPFVPSGWDELSMGLGVALLVIGVYFFTMILYFNILIKIQQVNDKEKK